MANKPVTVDLLHPTVVRAFTNWGYISFFGCIAALITLLFFAIGQLKQADEARGSIARTVSLGATRGEDSGSAPVQQDEVEVIENSSKKVVAPFIYRNEVIGFSFDYTPLIQKANLLNSDTLAMRMLGYSDGSRRSRLVDTTDQSYEGSGPWPVLVIEETLDSRSMDTYEADESARLIRVYGTKGAATIAVDRVSYGSNEVLRISVEPGLCHNETYTFFVGGHRVQLFSQCAGRQGREVFDGVLRTLALD